ncbi:hypothetical protein [Peptostreptococcus faecalis]|uniref:hypothetical protein n=1 Tax=Peptostreptococcus faecalis TaxID=2045015 RepID=UPI000C7C9CE5|nr:hypothetical protein [Peptostreptococcus faecalis]
MSAGWIKIHRKILENALWKDCTPEQKVIIITLLLMANHEKKKWIFSGKEYECEAGQFVTSLSSIQKNTGKEISTMQIRRCLEKLEKYNFLTSKATNKNRLITITNWEVYQNETDEPTSKPTSNRQATDKQPTPNKNVRIKELKNIDSIRCTSDESVKSEELKLKTEIELVVKEWNSIEGIRKVTRVAPKTLRYTQLKTRLSEYGIDKVLECVHGVERSSFLMGYVSENGWQATFDWFVKPANFLKVFEGNYEDKAKPNKPTSVPTPKQTAFHNFKSEHGEKSDEELNEMVRKLQKR